METGAVERFWENYINKAKSYRVPEKSIRWYVKRVEEFIQAHPSLQLSQHTEKSLETYFNQLSRNIKLADWQFKQAVEALQILFVELIRTDWAQKFPWDYWIDAATELAPSHGTVARDYHRPTGTENGVNVSLSKKIGTREQYSLILEFIALWPGFTRVFMTLKDIVLR